VRYLTSTGSALDLPDQSVDVFFAGESIEHVFNVDAFLDEVYRVLKPGGRFIVTTPNADACLYRAHGERYCHNGEHVSLMTYHELRELMDPRFETLVAKGFNGSFYRGFDDAATEAFADKWTAAFEDRPDLATGIVLMATPRPDRKVRRVIETEIHHTSPSVSYEGAWTSCSLHGPLTGRQAVDSSSRMTITWEGDGLVLFLWSHPWSGRAHMALDGKVTTRRTYSPVSGFVQQRWLDLPFKTHTLTLSPEPAGDPVAKGQSLIFWKAIGLRRTE
jgi:hypothetical protein